MRTLFAVSFIVASLSACEAAVIRVPADQSTIQSAVDATSSGDTVTFALVSARSPESVPALLSPLRCGSGQRLSLIHI